jgi:hypothetical protein
VSPAADDTFRIGWYLETDFGHVIFDPPKEIKADRVKPISRRAVQACPAVNNVEKDLFRILCPFSLSLSIEKRGSAFELYFDDVETRLDEDLFSKHIFFMPQDQWRNPKKPVIQMVLPYVFATDTHCYLSQYPPFLDNNSRNWPGTLIAGRFPLRNWPRSLNWAFEWQDFEQELKVKRGDPLFYVKFDGPNPDLRPELEFLTDTKLVSDYKRKIEGVPKYTGKTFELMGKAGFFRPEKLLKER